MSTLTTAWADHVRHRSTVTEWVQSPPECPAVASLVEPIRPDVNEGAMSALVGDNLRRLRKQHRLSLEELARQSGVSRAMLGQVEQGKSMPSIKTLWQVAQAFGVSVSWFLELGHASQVLLLSPTSGGQAPLSRGDGEIRSLQQVGERARDAFYELRLGVGAVLSLPASTGLRRVNVAVSSGALLAEVDDVAHVVKARDALQYQTRDALLWRNAGQVEAQAFVVIRDVVAID